MTVPIQDRRKLPDQLQTVAVACQLNLWEGTHAGFLYDRDDGSIWFCDVAWNLVCRNEVADPDKFCWVNINLRTEVLSFIAAALEEMDQNADAIPYDVRYSANEEYFDPITWSYSTTAPGLTCSTFILALLRSFRLELFNVLAWPSRAEDKASLDNLITKLETHGVDPTRIKNMRANHKNVRFRPEEVCAAVSHDMWPVSFQDAETEGKEVLQHVHRRIHLARPDSV